MLKKIVESRSLRVVLWLLLASCVSFKVEVSFTSPARAAVASWEVVRTAILGTEDF